MSGAVGPVNAGHAEALTRNGLDPADYVTLSLTALPALGGGVAPDGSLVLQLMFPVPPSVVAVPSPLLTPEQRFGELIRKLNIAIAGAVLIVRKDALTVAVEVPETPAIIGDLKWD